MLLSLMLAVAACGHDSPSERELASGRPGGEVQAPTGSGQRPGVGEANSMAKELADGVWRIAGPGTSLRYDRGAFPEDSPSPRNIPSGDVFLRLVEV